MSLDITRDQVEPNERGVRRIEIEQRLTKHPTFSRTPVVVYQFGSSDTSHVVAFCQASHSLSSQTLCDHAAEVLPSSMVPDIFILVDEFPLTGSGELDSERLAELAASEVRQSSEEIPVLRHDDRKVAESIRECFAELLEVELDSIRPDDDFFDLGGSSIDCVELFAWIEENFGIDLPLSTITSAPTVRLLATTINLQLSADTRRSTSGGPPAEQWEWMLCILWSEILDIDVVEPQDNFFDLGGTTADVQRMTERLRAIYGIHVALSDVVRAPTVAQLAALARGRSTGSCLVPLNVAGVKSPFFCIAGLGGLALAFLPLSRELGADQPFYGLQSHGIDRRGLPDYTIRRVVARYTQAIRSVQPHGPYLIGGHSHGGLLALEVSQRLAAEDEEVALLTVFDTVLPERLTGEKMPAPMDPTARALRIGWPRRQTLIKASNFLRLPVAGLVRQRGEAQTEAFRLVGRVQTRFAKQLRPWTGLAAVVVSDEQPNKDYLLSTWGQLLTGSWTHVSSPGDHLTMMQRPHVTQLARHLKELLAQVSSLDVATPTDEDSRGEQRPT